MPKVPFNPEEKPLSPMAEEQPSPENLLMAAAIMHQQGKFAQPQAAPSAPRRRNPSLKVVR